MVCQLCGRPGTTVLPQTRETDTSLVKHARTEIFLTANSGVDLPGNRACTHRRPELPHNHIDFQTNARAAGVRRLHGLGEPLAPDDYERCVRFFMAMIRDTVSEN